MLSLDSCFQKVGKGITLFLILHSPAWDVPSKCFPCTGLDFEDVK